MRDGQLPGEEDKRLAALPTGGTEMKKSMKFATALAGAAVVVAGGTAFTAANTMPANTFVGTGNSVVSGVTVTGTAVTLGAAPDLDMGTIVFTTTDDFSQLAPLPTVLSTLTDGGTLVGTGACTPTKANPSIITCNYTAEAGKDIKAATVDGLTLTVK